MSDHVPFDRIATDLQVLRTDQNIKVILMKMFIYLRFYTRSSKVKEGIEPLLKQYLNFLFDSNYCSPKVSVTIFRKITTQAWLIIAPLVFVGCGPSSSSSSNIHGYLGVDQSTGGSTLFHTQPINVELKYLVSECSGTYRISKAPNASSVYTCDGEEKTVLGPLTEDQFRTYLIGFLHHIVDDIQRNDLKMAIKRFLLLKESAEKTTDENFIFAERIVRTEVDRLIEDYRNQRFTQFFWPDNLAELVNAAGDVSAETVQIKSGDNFTLALLSRLKAYVNSPIQSQEFLQALQSKTQSNPDGSICGRVAHSAVVYGDGFYFWGGSHRISNERPDGLEVVSEDLLKGGFLSFDGKQGLPSAIDTLENAPPSLRDHTALTHNDSMVIWGGYDGKNSINSGFIYDFKSTTWSSIERPKAFYLAPRFAHGTALFNENKMFVWGGRDLKEITPKGTLGAIYDLESKTWEAIPEDLLNQPGPRSYPAVAALGDSILVWGGEVLDFENKLRYLGDGAVYLPKEKRWIPIPTLDNPSPRSRAFALSFDNNFYLFGGSSGPGFKTGVYKLEITQDSAKWRIVSPGTSKNISGESVLSQLSTSLDVSYTFYQNHVYIVGGSKATGEGLQIIPEAAVFDMQTLLWK